MRHGHVPLPRWCEEYDELYAATPSGASTTIPYTVAHFGPPLPEGGLTLELAQTTPEDACEPLTSIAIGSGNMTALAHSARARQPLAPRASP